MASVAEYGVLFVGVLVLAFVAFSAFSPPKYEVGAQGQVVQTAANLQYFQQQAAQSGSECGDLKDTANVQHLSHHPSQYADCLKQVDPAFLQKATGQTFQQIIGGGGSGGETNAQMMARMHPSG